MSTLYLIRHGQASFGADDYDRLSDLGRRQAGILGDFLLHAGIRFDAVWTGRLRRQRETADAVRQAYDAAGESFPSGGVAPGFDEYDARGVLQALVPRIERSDPDFRREVKSMMASRNAFQQVFARVMNLYASGRVHLSDIPAWADFCSGAQAAVAAVTGDSPGGSHVAAFTSGGPVAAAVGGVLGLGAQEIMALSWQLVNASVTRLRFSPGRIGLATFNEHGHLERGTAGGLVTYR